MTEEIDKLVTAQEEALEQIIQERDWDNYEEDQIVRTRIENHPEYDRMWLLKKNETPIEITFEEIKKLILENQPDKNETTENTLKKLTNKFNFSLGITTILIITTAFITLAIGTNGLAEAFPQ